MSLILFEASELHELKQRAEKPENYILKPEQAASALDKDVYRIFLEMLDPQTGPFSLAVCYSITKGLKGGVSMLFRHASFKDSKGVAKQHLCAVLTVCAELGFTGSAVDWHIESHPRDPSIIAIFQEFTQPTIPLGETHGQGQEE